MSLQYISKEMPIEVQMCNQSMNECFQLHNSFLYKQSEIINKSLRSTEIHEKFKKLMKEENMF